ncbi:MAG: heme ABC exporter ATP-binding protein CcmA [Chloroflexi bacterium]|nr:heme ABC exporter ATP-binding protein CcmA [Chloroflexota bacterium]
MIHVRGLVKRFGYTVVLKGISLDIEAGESVVLLGPNGAGKTTLLRILATLLKPSAGRVTVAGEDIVRHPQAVRHLLGYVSHHPLLYPDLTARENLRFYAQLYGLPEPDARIDELLERVGLARRGDDLVRTFSRGMVQRLTIARALLHNPPILLLDEPDTGLDPQAANMLARLLQDVAVEGRTILLTTHNLSRGVDFARRVVVLAGGRIVTDRPTEGLEVQDLSRLYLDAVAQEAA